MLGVSLIGMFTKRRGSDAGNIVAIPAGLLATVVAGKLHITILNTAAPLFGIHRTFAQHVAIPEVSFTWWPMIGALVVFCVGVLFRTPDQVLEARLAMPRRLRPPSMFRSPCVHRWSKRLCRVTF